MSMHTHFWHCSALSYHILLAAFQVNHSILLLPLRAQGDWHIRGFLKSLSYFSPTPEQPNHADEENCVVIRTEFSGRWQNRDCYVALPYVCKKRLNATLDPFTTGPFMSLYFSPLDKTSFAVPPFQNLLFYVIICFASTDSWADDEKYECDVGWQAFQAGCYKLASEKTDWNAAQKTCQKMEANLVSIHTLPELEFIMRNLKKGDLALVFHTVSSPCLFTVFVMPNLCFCQKNWTFVRSLLSEACAARVSTRS